MKQREKASASLFACPIEELTCRSNLPGLVKAGSRISGKFVAAINIIPYKINNESPEI